MVCCITQGTEIANTDRKPERGSVSGKELLHVGHFRKIWMCLTIQLLQTRNKKRFIIIMYNMSSITHVSVTLGS